MKKIIKTILFLFFFFFLLSQNSWAAETTCLVYFSGQGCPHCAQTDPVILEELPQKYPDLAVIKYEIYQNKENAPLLYQYNQVYHGGLGVPLVIFDQETSLLGDRPILANIEKTLEEKKGNLCPLVDGQAVAFEKIEASSLPGRPQIWPKEESKPPASEPPRQSEFTLAKVFSLAAADSINPCALAVLTLMLLAIMTLGSKKRSDLLLAGLAFTFSVLVMYFFYGLLIVKAFQVVQAISGLKFWLYKILGFLAIILGLLNLKDFVRYQPGGLLTEMPLFLRPKAQSLFFKVTSPRGAFGVGALVTLFLLPCTIGPYVIAGGLISSLSLLEALPWLLLYNLVFILPMLAITGLCYLGITTAERAKSWRKENVRYLHLVAGLIILGLGIAMVSGLF